MKKILYIFIVFILITTGMTLFIIWNNENKEESKLQIQQTKIESENFTKNNEENPKEIAERLIRSSFLNNDREFMNERSYCDSLCQKIIKENLGITFEEYVDWTWKMGDLERKIAINNLEVNIKNKTKNKANIEYTINYSNIDSDGDIGEGSSAWTLDFDLIKVDDKWMMNEVDALDYAIPIIKNYQKLFTNLEKCHQMGNKEFNVPMEGGTFSVDDKDNPLYGFSIRFPKLKESMKISVGCSEFPPMAMGDEYISLPVSIKSDKIFLDILPDESFFPLAIPGISKIDNDKKYAGKFPLIKIPYNTDIAIDEKVSISNPTPFTFINASFDDWKNSGDSDFLFAWLDPNSHIAKGFFSTLFNTWVVSAQKTLD